MSICSSLNTDTSLMILSYLEIDAVAKCSSVSKTWKALASDEGLWQELLRGLPSAFRTKAFAASKGRIRSLEELYDKVSNFINTIAPNQKGIFTCIFAIKPQGCFFNVKFGEGEVVTSRQVHIFTKCPDNWKEEGETSERYTWSGGIEMRVNSSNTVDLGRLVDTLFNLQARRLNHFHEASGSFVRYAVRALPEDN